METACMDVETEIAALDVEAQAIRDDLQSTVGDLSDLRYGKFNRPSDATETVGQEVMEGLRRLEQLCDRVGSKT
jgi:centromere-localized protein 2